MIIDGNLTKAQALALALEELGDRGFTVTTYVFRDQRGQWVGCQREVPPGIRRFESIVCEYLQRVGRAYIWELRRELFDDAGRCQRRREPKVVLDNALQTLRERGQVKYDRIGGWGLVTQ